MLKIKEWKYRDMMDKVVCYGDKWMDIDDFARDPENFDQVIVEDGYVTFNGLVEIEKETEKAYKIRLDASWSEWMPKSAVIM